MNLPLKHGLAEPRASAEDDRIRFDFRLLQAMDLISLCMCCSKLPQGETNDVLKSPTGEPIKLRLRRRPDGVLHIDPWPFDQLRIELSVGARRLPVRKFDSVEEFRSVYQLAPVERVGVVVGA
jgi:hypothetical protein